MPRESKKSVRERSLQIFDLLLQEYPDAHCALEHEGPFQLGVATILSAQTTDERVNMVTPKLFLGYPSPNDLASASQKDVETLIHSTGFFRNKAKNIIGFAKGIVEKHGGKVPRTIEELTALPGVGRKTANVILGNAFGINEGVVVDTHVKRISNLLALTREANPEKFCSMCGEIFVRGPLDIEKCECAMTCAICLELLPEDPFETHECE